MLGGGRMKKGSNVILLCVDPIIPASFVEDTILLHPHPAPCHPLNCFTTLVENQLIYIFFKLFLMSLFKHAMFLAGS